MKLFAIHVEDYSEVVKICLQWKTTKRVIEFVRIEIFLFALFQFLHQNIHVFFFRLLMFGKEKFWVLVKFSKMNFYNYCTFKIEKSKMNFSVSINSTVKYFVFTSHVDSTWNFFAKVDFCLCVWIRVKFQILWPVLERGISC